MSDREQRLAAQDEAFRNRMKNQAEAGNPAATKWVESDTKAAEADAAVSEIGQQIEEAPSRLDHAEKVLRYARDRRDNHLQSGAPNVFMSEKRKEWMSKRDELNGEVADGENQLLEAAEASSPEQIAAMQDQLKTQMQERNQALEERRNTALLPSERAEAKKAMARDPMENEAMSGYQESEQSQASDTQARSGIRTSHGYETYGATAKDEHDRQKAYQAREDAYRQDGHLGEGIVTEQMIEEYEAKMAQANGQQPQGQDNNQQELPQSQNQQPQANRPAFADLVAEQRRQGQEEEGDQQGQATSQPEPAQRLSMRELMEQRRTQVPAEEPQAQVQAQEPQVEEQVETQRRGSFMRR